MKVVLLAAAALLVLAASGAEARRSLAREPGYADFSPSVSPDGSRVAFARESVTPHHFVRYPSLYLAGMDGRGVVALTQGSVGSPANGMLGHFDQGVTPSWSPDGRRLVYAHQYQGTRYDYFHSELVVVDADGSNARTITSTQPTDFFRVFSPSWSSRNQIAFRGVGDDRIWVINPDGTGLTRLVSGSAGDPAWSPDGAKIVFLKSPSTGITTDITVMNADGSDERVIASLDGVSAPAWSPDGAMLAFSATLDSDAGDIYALDLDGSNLRRLTTNPAHDSSPSWTPEGNSIVFRSMRGRGVNSGDLWIMNADGSNQRLLIPRAPKHASNGRRCSITGTAAFDFLEGTSASDVLCAFAGNDKAFGRDGNDVLDGGPQKDVLDGGSGNDLILARDGRKDTVRGGTGFDRAQVDGGVDKVSGVEKILR